MLIYVLIMKILQDDSLFVYLQLYKCFCSKAAKTKVQLRKKQNDKHNKSENVASGTIMSEKTKQHDSNPRKEEKTRIKISEMFRQQKSIDGTKQQSKLNQFFK